MSRGTAGLVALLLALPHAALAARPVPAAAPGPADTLRISLEEAVTRSLAQGEDARIARANVGIADGQVTEATAQALPQITGTVTYDRKFSSVFSSLGTSGDLAALFKNTSFGAQHTWTADLTVTQLLWSGGRVGAGLAAARAARASVRADRDETLADVALDTRGAYLAAVYAREVQAIAEDGLAQARAHLARVKQFHDQGSRSDYELLQAQVDAANQEPAVVSARNTTQTSLLELRRRLHLPLEQPLVLTTALAFGEGQLPVLAGDAGDGGARVALRGAEDMVLARREALRAEKGARWPQLTVQADVQHQAYPADGIPVRRDFYRAVDGYLKLTWPVFQGFRTFGTVERARSELAQAEAERDRQRAGVALQVAEARREVERALAAVAARRGTARLARRAHDLAEIRWKNGLSTQLEVSDSRLQMQTAEVNEVSALMDYRLALLRLERATGRPLALENRSIDDLSDDVSDVGER